MVQGHRVCPLKDIYVKPLPSDPDMTAIPDGKTIIVYSPDGQQYKIKVQRLPGVHASSLGKRSPDAQLPDAHRMCVDEPSPVEQVAAQLEATGLR